MKAGSEARGYARHFTDGWNDGFEGIWPRYKGGPGSPWWVQAYLDGWDASQVSGSASAQDELMQRDLENGRGCAGPRGGV